MNFNNLHIEKFLTIDTATVNLADRGLHLVQGENDADTSASSNGAGKSSLVDAICWVLFGATAREVTGDKVINRTAKKGTLVQLEMQNGATLYQVSRHRKHHTGKNSLQLKVLPVLPGGASIDMTKGTDSETQKEVERVLGCGQEMFMAAVYSGQGVMPDLPRMTDKQLKMLIEESAGLSRIERAYTVALARANANAKAVVGKKAATASVAAAVVVAEGNVAAAKSDGVDWESHRTSKVVSLKAEILDIESVRIPAAKSALAAALTPAQAAAQRTKEINAELAAFATKRTAAAEARKEQGRLDRLINRTGHEHVKGLHTKAQVAFDNAEAEMAKPCPECNKPHTPEELETFKAHLSKRLQDCLDAVRKSGAELVAAASLALAAKKTADELEQALPDVTELVAEAKRLQEPIANYSTRKTESEAAQKYLENKQADHDNAISAPNPYAPSLGRAEAQEKNCRDSAETLAVELAALEMKVKVDEILVKLFGPAGVRAQILDSVTPYLNDRTADYLSVLSDGNLNACWSTLTKSAAGELKEKFSIEVSNDEGSESFLGLSGGEKRKVQIATALALQDLVASRATNPIGLWIGDEVDDALDPAGLERLMTILERRARERGTVIVISHSDLRDWVDNVTIVRKKDGLSKVEGSLCV